MYHPNNESIGGLISCVPIVIQLCIFVIVYNSEHLGLQ